MRPTYQIGSKGFTLIEVLLAVSVFAFGISHIFVIFGDSSSVIRHSGNRLASGVFIENHIWEIRRKVNEGKVPASGRYYERFDHGPTEFEFSCYVEPSPLSEGLYHARIGLSWKEGMKEITVNREIFLRRIPGKGK